MATDLKESLNLPRTEFPMRAGLAAREPRRVAHWDKTRLYQRIQEKNADGPAFVLHDGPPFTNGDLHLGHVLNKTLKDITLRYKSLRGFRTPYVPGWDCHGLPIEQKVSREVQEKGETLSIPEFRERCDAFSEHWIDRQREQFQRLGVLADWENEYKTKDPAFEADILRTFAAFVEKKLVYRSKKPVYWSIPFETALAEAEIEYRDHVSPSIWVKFPVPPEELRKINLSFDHPVFVVIWTTTPWTIPGNLAIALHPEINYAFIEDKIRNETYIIAEDLARSFTETILSNSETKSDPTKKQNTGDPVAAINNSLQGKALEGIVARHPLINRAAPIVLADYVTTESGTGCVHTAPGHGQEDYLTGLKYNLEIYCPVGDDGCFIDDGRIPPDLVGLSTLETVEDLAKKRTSPANVAVLKSLAAAGALLAKKKLTHSYPHCWRSKTPIIFRAVDQWFASLDAAPASPRKAALEAIDRVTWIPAWGEARIRGAVESRPDWCISRQRAWGVPIPAFYDEEGQGYLDARVVRAIADKVETAGTNLWFGASARDLLDGIELPDNWPSPAKLTPGRDTLDVWFDSGSTHAATLRRNLAGTHWPADMYLEGSDQHRGWFQSSLWTGIIALDAPPFKSVLTHGFIVDEERRKLSKSNTYEKPQTSEAYVASHGADVMRLWVASQDFRDDTPVSDEILANVAETYRSFRNTFRYQISNLYDFDPSRDALPIAELDAFDRWALGKTAEMVRRAQQAYENYEFHRVYQTCNLFCTVTLSAIYHDILKDRLYTLRAGSPLRRSSQTALDLISRALARVLSPVLTFTADEAWSFGRHRDEYTDDSVHLAGWPDEAAGWDTGTAVPEIDRLLIVRQRVNESLEQARRNGEIGKSLEAAVTISFDPESEIGRLIEAHADRLPELFIVSQVDFDRKAGVEPDIAVRPAPGMRCPRCWRHVPTLEPDSGVCSRCTEALSF